MLFGIGGLVSARPGGRYCVWNRIFPESLLRNGLAAQELSMQGFHSRTTGSFKLPVYCLYAPAINSLTGFGLLVHSFVAAQQVIILPR